MYIEEASLVVNVFLSPLGTNQEQKIKTALETLEKAIEYKNSNVLAGNERLKNELADFINQKKKQLEADEKLLDEIIKRVPVNLEKKGEKPSTVNFAVREVIKPVYPKAQELQEPFIEAEKVNAVIELLKNSGLSFETTPKVYSKMEEEELRDILLSHLNCVFQGDATGETFVKKGKTDIHLKMGKGSILSMECKFWEGEKNYHSMINQLFGYLTWRQNYGILITFSKRENFSEVLEKAKNAASTHPTSATNSLKIVNASHFVTSNRFPEDNAKSVCVNHLLFNLFFR
jgi:hypothetical protein